MTNTKTASIKAEALSSGDRVALVAPSSRPYSMHEVARAKKLVEEMGYVASLGEHVLDTHGYMAGTDEVRSADLNRAFEDRQIKGVFILRGGYGALRLLPNLNYQALIENPKVIIASKDATSILLAIHKQTRLTVFYGPDLVDIVDSQTFNLFSTVLKSREIFDSIEPNKEFGGGGKFSDFCHHDLEQDIEGKLIGGNLTSLVSLMGTKFEPAIVDHILFLNDYKERNDILDRWLTTLCVSSKMQSTKAVVYGQFKDCYQRGTFSMHSIYELIIERMTQLNKPYLLGFPLGEGGKHSILPIGSKVRLEAKTGAMTFLEAALV